jgi:asparagine synthase (glutamine-hydrolysing)
MPGIVGLITKKSREWAEPQLLRMVESVSHEAFYVNGTWIDDGLGLYSGWVERRGAFSDGMPVSNERGDVQLIFSGEDFPEKGTAELLKQKGHSVGSAAASYLAHRYEDDPDFLKNLNGRFHGLLADRTHGTVTLFNDRYGLHRIYYHQSKEAFYFAAEAKAILAVRSELRTIDSRGLGEFIACGCVLENRTLFQGLHVLPPASAWIFRGGWLEKKTAYFEEREWEEQSVLAPEPYYQELREVFSQNLPRYFNGTQPVGMSLTGGLDTRMILASHKSASGSLPCYSFGGPYRDSADVAIGRRLARVSGQSFEVIPVAEDFLSSFSKYAERTVFLSDGCVDVSHSPDLYVNERAKNIAPVRMTGNYGGEVLRRVRAFKPVQPPADLFHPEILNFVASAADTYKAQLGIHPLSFAVFRQAPWHHYGLLSLEESQLSLRSPFLDNGFVKTVFRAPESACVNNDVSLRLIADGDPALARIPTDRGFGGIPRFYDPLNQGFIEFTVKAEYAYDYGMPQSVARIDHLLAPLHLERIFLGRHKFKHFRVWYRDRLSKYVKEILLDPRAVSRTYVKPRMVESIVQDHISGRRNYTSSINKLLTLEFIHRLFVDSQ